MQIGFVGLGKMGGNMVERLMLGGHQCVIFNRTANKVQEYAKKGATPSFSLAELAGNSPAVKQYG